MPSTSRDYTTVIEGEFIPKDERVFINTSWSMKDAEFERLDTPEPDPEIVYYCKFKPEPKDLNDDFWVALLLGSVVCMAWFLISYLPG
ncbi:hypothetical protein D3C79_49310 [compost metagenome]